MRVFLPLVSGALPFDLSMVPVSFMTVLYAFIGEPLSNWLQLIIYIKWSIFYSVCYYIGTGISVKAFVDKLKRMEGA